MAEFQHNEGEHLSTQVEQLATLVANLQAQLAAVSGTNPRPLPLKASKPETFSGSSTQTDVGSWLFQLRQYLLLSHKALADQAEGIVYAASFFRGHAALWWRSQVEANGKVCPYLTWESFAEAVKLQFRPVNAVKAARDCLASLTQQRSVQDYVSQFRILCLQIPDISEGEKMDRFVRGLKPQIQREVEMKEPQTFEEVIRMVERADAVEFRIRQRYAPPTQRTFSPRTTAISAPTHITPTFSSAPTTMGPTAMELGAIRLAPLTVAERERLRKIGGCFRCRKVGHISSQCPSIP